LGCNRLGDHGSIDSFHSPCGTYAEHDARGMLSRALLIHVSKASSRA
jgi:hypothetical protein